MQFCYANSYLEIQLKCKKNMLLWTLDAGNMRKIKDGLQNSYFLFGLVEILSVLPIKATKRRWYTVVTHSNPQANPPLLCADVQRKCRMSDGM